MTDFEIHVKTHTQKLISKLTQSDTQLDSLLDRLAKYITNKPEIIRQIANTKMPSPSKLIHALVRLAMYSPAERLMEINKWLNTNVTWLDTTTHNHISGVCLAVLKYLEEWLEYSNASTILSREQISIRIYQLLNCLAAGLCTTSLFYGQLPPCKYKTYSYTIPFLFVVAGCYTLLDSLIDLPSSQANYNTKLAIKIFDWYITQLETRQQQPTMYPLCELEPVMQEYTRSLHWLVCLLIKSILDDNQLHVVIGIMRLCFNVEIRCFREQTLSSQSSESIIQLGVLKGISTGYLICQGVITPLYSEYSVLVQLLDDLSDYMEDSQAEIRGFPACAHGGLQDYAIFVGECLAEFIDSYTKCLARDPDLLLGGPDAAEYVIPALIMYWIYCMCKTPQLADLTQKCIERLDLSSIMDPNRILDSRLEKHAALQNLWKIVKQFRC
jgi:hypothetical protein